MSGFVGKSGSYDLSATKALHWHRFRSDGCQSLADILRAHVLEEGFTVLLHWTWARVSGPGLKDGWTDELYLAISGKASAARVPGRRWS